MDGGINIIILWKIRQYQLVFRGEASADKEVLNLLFFHIRDIFGKDTTFIRIHGKN